MTAQTPRIVVYSCYFGDPEPFNDRALDLCAAYDRVLFTDRDDVVPSGVKIIRSDSRALGPALESRRAKMLPHRWFCDHDWAIYVDNRASLLTDPVNIIAKTGAGADPGLYVFKHPERSDPADELDACLLLGHIKKEQWQVLHELYRDTRMPATLGLTHNAVMIHHLGNPHTEAMLELWWELFLAYAKRDQLTMQLAEHLAGQPATRLSCPLGEVADWPVFLPSQRARSTHAWNRQKPPSWTLAKLRYKMERRMIKRLIAMRNSRAPKG